jgi:hypothetical protein
MTYVDNTMTLECFVDERLAHESCMQFWINSDEDTVVLDIDPDKLPGFASVSVRLITSKIYDFDGDKKDAQAWGIPFDELAKFVDAVRALQGAKV